jgi:hypothetical protein
MSTTPLGPPPGDGEPPPAGPWATDNLPPRPEAYGAQVEQPPSILTAVRLMWVGAALSAISILVALLQIDAVRDQIEENDSSLTESELDGAVAGFVAITIVSGLIAVGLWIWMANTNGKGLSWARGVATGLGVINLLFSGFNLVSSQSTGLAKLFSVVSIVLAAVILYLLYRPDSSAYYRSRSGR